MTTSPSIQALRRANPRTRAGFAESVEATAEALHAQLATTATDVVDDGGASLPAAGPPAPRRATRVATGRPAPGRRVARGSAVGALVAAVAAVAAFLAIAAPGAGPGVANAAVAVSKAATVTAAAAERSGTAVVRITHNREDWAGTTVRWHGDDLAKEDIAASRDVPRRPGKAGSRLLLVDGTMYGVDPDDGGWVVLGSPDSIDPDSGTTPEEYLAAVREDVGGSTLRRITDGMTGLTTRQLDNGSTVYSGTVAAGLIARETGFKEGQSIRVLPFGYVAHEDATNPAAPLQTAVTVAPDGIVRELTVAWGAGASQWTYKVTYSALGATPAPTAPANARPLRRVLRGQAQPAPGGGR